MFENPRRGRQAKNFATNVPKILDLKSSSEQIFFRKLSLGAPEIYPPVYESQVNSVTGLFCRVRRLILGPRTVEIENSDIS